MLRVIATTLNQTFEMLQVCRTLLFYLYEKEEMILKYLKKLVLVIESFKEKILII